MRRGDAAAAGGAEGRVRAVGPAARRRGARVELPSRTERAECPGAEGAEGWARLGGDAQRRSALPPGNERRCSPGERTEPFGVSEVFCVLK